MQRDTFYITHLYLNVETQSDYAAQHCYDYSHLSGVPLKRLQSLSMTRGPDFRLSCIQIHVILCVSK